MNQATLDRIHVHAEVDLIIDLEISGQKISCPVVDRLKYNNIEYLIAKNMKDKNVYVFRLVNNKIAPVTGSELLVVNEYYNSTVIKDEGDSDEY